MTQRIPNSTEVSVRTRRGTELEIRAKKFSGHGPYEGFSVLTLDFGPHESVVKMFLDSEGSDIQQIASALQTLAVELARTGDADRTFSLAGENWTEEDE